MEFSQSESTLELNSNCTNATYWERMEKVSKATSTYYITIKERREKAGESLAYIEAQEDDCVLTVDYWLFITEETEVHL